MIVSQVSENHNLSGNSQVPDVYYILRQSKVFSQEIYRRKKMYGNGLYESHHKRISEMKEGAMAELEHIFEEIICRTKYLALGCSEQQTLFEALPEHNIDHYKSLEKKLREVEIDSLA